MALKHARESGRAAFTLVELLVVIGLMAVLATISVAGYSAATRGMADRGVIQTTTSILHIARQACQIDRVPTKVLFFNRRLSTENEDSATLFQGTAIAIKQAGRITISPSQANNLLVDEFADWHQSYPMRGSKNAPGMRIYRMKGDGEGKGLERCSMLVEPFVTHYALNDYMIQSGTEISTWCKDHRRSADDNRPKGVTSSYVPNGNNYVWGFKQRSGASGVNMSGWEVGTPYGIEIARIDLPRGYIFGTSQPKKRDELEDASPSEVSFDPEELIPSQSVDVPVCAMRPGTGGDFTIRMVNRVKLSNEDN